MDALRYSNISRARYGISIDDKTVTVTSRYFLTIGFCRSGTELIPILILLFFLVERPLQKSLVFRRFKSDRDEIPYGMFLQVNSHRLTKSDFRFDVTLSRWRPSRHLTQKSAATWSVNTKRRVSGGS